MIKRHYKNKENTKSSNNGNKNINYSNEQSEPTNQLARLQKYRPKQFEVRALNSLSEIEQCRDRLDKEVAVVNGAKKLAQSANREDQYLEALKAYYVANARATCIAADLQRFKCINKELAQRTKNGELQPESNVEHCSGKLMLKHTDIPLQWSRNFIDECNKRREAKKPVTRLATFMVAKLVYKNHTRILDTEMVCLPEGAGRLTFKSPICFDSVPHDFMVELTLLVLPMSDVPAVADNNTKLLKILKKRHKVLEDIVKTAVKLESKSKSDKSLRSSFRVKLKKQSDGESEISTDYLEKGDWVVFGKTRVNLSNANVNTGNTYQVGDLRLTRHGNMLHRFLPVQLDYRMSLTVRPNCFDETSCEGYVNYYDENSSCGPPTWRYLYADVISGKFRLWHDLDHRAQATAHELGKLSGTINNDSGVISPILSVDITHPDIKIQEIEQNRSRRPNSFQVRDFVCRHVFCTGDKEISREFVLSMRRHRRDLVVWAPVIKVELDERDRERYDSGNGQNGSKIENYGKMENSRTSQESQDSGGAAMRELMNRGLYSADSPKNKKREGDQKVLKEIPTKSPRHSLEKIGLDKKGLQVSSSFNFKAGSMVNQVPWGGLFEQSHQNRKVIKNPIKTDFVNSPRKQPQHSNSPATKFHSPVANRNISSRQFSPVASPFNRDSTFLGAPGSCSTVSEKKKKKNRRRSKSAERAPITKSKQPVLYQIREEASYNKENSYCSDFSPRRRAPPTPKQKEVSTPERKVYTEIKQNQSETFESPTSPTFDDLLKEYKSKLMVPSIGGLKAQSRRRRSKSVDYSTQSPFSKSPIKNSPLSNPPASKPQLSRRAEEQLCPDQIRGRNWASPANRVMKVIMPAQKDKIYYFREEERKKRIVPLENLSPVAQYDANGKQWLKSPENPKIKSSKVKSPISNSRDMSPAAALSLGMNSNHPKTDSTKVNLGRPETPEHEKREYNLRSISNASIGSTGSGRLSFQTAVSENKTNIRKEKVGVSCGLIKSPKNNRRSDFNLSPKLNKSSPKATVKSTTKPYARRSPRNFKNSQLKPVLEYKSSEFKSSEYKPSEFKSTEYKSSEYKSVKPVITTKHGGPDLADVLRQQQKARNNRNQNMNKSGIYAPRSFKPIDKY